MIIKSLRHSANTIKKLVNYMVNGMQDPEKDMMISHNLPSFDTDEITKAFLANDEYRKKGRGTVRWYHDVMSFAPSDSKHLDNNALEQLAQEYIDLRCKSGLAFATAHMSEAHIHVHICYSSTEYRSKSNLFLNNKQFMGIRVALEQFQQKHFPELQSIVYLDREKQKKRGKSASQEREYQTKQRLGRQMTEKEEVSTLLKKLYDGSRSVAELVKAIQQSGYEVYYRNGKFAGVLANRKYRFSTLGITRAMFANLERLEKLRRDVKQLSRDDERER